MSGVPVRAVRYVRDIGEYRYCTHLASSSPRENLCRACPSAFWATLAITIASGTRQQGSCNVTYSVVWYSYHTVVRVHVVCLAGLEIE